MRRVWAQMRKELVQVRRDRLALALLLLLPSGLLLLMTNAISLSVTDVPLVIQDQDGSPEARRLSEAFRASLSFRVVAAPEGKKPEWILSASLARGVLVIPPHFGRNFRRGRLAEMQLLVDATDTNTARLVQGYAMRVVRAFETSQRGEAAGGLIRPQTRLWFNPGRDPHKFYGPGIFVLGISMFPALLAALAASREGEQKTILQVYVSNISAGEFLLGKVFAFALIALVEWLVTVTVLMAVFGLRLAGDPTPLLAGTVLYALCVASFGVMVGTAIPSQAAAVQAVALGGFLLVFLLSGLIFPVENIPSGLRWISYLVWGRYYIEIVRDAFLRGGGWPAVWPGIVAIGLLASALFLLAWRRMRPMQVEA